MRGLRLCLVVAVLATVWLVTRPGPVSQWVAVDVDPYATVAHPLRLNMHVAPQATPGYVVADLHWSSTRREPRGFLVGGTVQSIPIEGGAFAFDYRVPDRGDLGYVHAVIYLGPTGRWEDRIRWASTDLIPFQRATTTANAAVKPWPVRDHAGEAAESRPFRSTLVTWLTAVVLIAAAARCIRVWQATRGGARSSLTAGRWLVFASFACVTAALWTIVGAETVLGSEGRRWALDARLYHERAAIQKIVTVLVVAVAALAVTWMLPKFGNAGRAVLLGLISFGTVAGLDVLSLHEIDSLFNEAWWGIPALQWLELAASLVALIGTALDGLFTQATPVGRTRVY